MPIWVYTIGIYAVIIAGGYWYYTSTQAEILDLNLANAAYMSANATQLETIKRQTEDAKENQAAYIELDKKLDLAEVYSNSLEKKLQKHDRSRVKARCQNFALCGGGRLSRCIGGQNF